MPTLSEREAERLEKREALHLAALDMQRRLSSGEAVPLEELRNFISAANKTFSEIRVERNAKEEKKQKSHTEIDFF